MAGLESAELSPSCTLAEAISGITKFDLLGEFHEKLPNSILGT